MNETEFVSYMKYLGTAFGKDYSREEIEVYYDFLKEYSPKTFASAVKSIIKNSKFAPKVNELIETCERCKEHLKHDVLEYMKKCGYFKIPQEYDKAVTWLEKDNVPTWFKEDMNEYAKKMNAQALESKRVLEIECQSG